MLFSLSESRAYLVTNKCPFYLNRDSLASTSFCVHLDNKFTPHTNIFINSAHKFATHFNLFLAWPSMTKNNCPRSKCAIYCAATLRPITSWLNLRPLYTQSYCQTCLIRSQQDHSSADQALFCTPSKEVCYALFWVFIFCFVVCPQLWCVCWYAFSFYVWAR